MGGGGPPRSNSRRQTGAARPQDAICGELLLVGAGRFELPTPSPPDWCANQAALRSGAPLLPLPHARSTAAQRQRFQGADLNWR